MVRPTSVEKDPGKCSGPTPAAGRARIGMLEFKELSWIEPTHSLQAPFACCPDPAHPPEQERAARPSAPRVGYSGGNQEGKHDPLLRQRLYTGDCLYSRQPGQRE